MTPVMEVLKELREQGFESHISYRSGSNELTIKLKYGSYAIGRKVILFDNVDVSYILKDMKKSLMEMFKNNKCKDCDHCYSLKELGYYWLDVACNLYAVSRTSINRDMEACEYFERKKDKGAGNCE